MKIRQEKCLVLESGAFIGSRLTMELLQTGYHVRILERPNLSKAGLPFGYPPVEWFEGDFLNREELEAAVEGCSIIFHLICTTLPKSSNENPIYDVESNVIGSIQLLEIARSHNVQKVVFLASGGTVYGNSLGLCIVVFHLT